MMRPLRSGARANAASSATPKFGHSVASAYSACRPGNDLTRQFPLIAETLPGLRCGPALSTARWSTMFRCILVAGRNQSPIAGI
jgi:hypothetical protein